MPAGAIGSCWTSGSWTDTAWEGDSWSDGSAVVCDYPSEDDVVVGVIYANGTMTGNVTLPDPSNVRWGVQYGAEGVQYTGTFGVDPVDPPIDGTSPFAAVAASIKIQLILQTGLDPAFVRVVANDRYKVTINEPFFLYVRFYGVAEPRDPALRFTDSGAGRLSTPVGRRVRVYVYTRSGADTYGDDTIALLSADPSQTVATPPTLPGQFVAEELVFNALNNFLPMSAGASAEPLTLTPLHPLDASEEPQRPMEDEQGLLRSCLDFEICYLLAIDPRDPAPT